MDDRPAHRWWLRPVLTGLVVVVVVVVVSFLVKWVLDGAMPPPTDGALGGAA